MRRRSRTEQNSQITVTFVGVFLSRVWTLGFAIFLLLLIFVPSLLLSMPFLENVGSPLSSFVGDALAATGNARRWAPRNPGLVSFFPWANPTSQIPLRRVGECFPTEPREGRGKGNIRRPKSIRCPLSKRTRVAAPKYRIVQLRRHAQREM